MTRYILRRLGYMVITLWVIITVTFFLMNTLPGDPVAAKFNKMPPQIQENMKKKWQLDKPLPQRYLIYLGNVVKGNLGDSFITPGVSSNQIIKERFPNSARLGLQAVIFGVLIGLILGILAAFNRNTWVDYLVIFIAMLGVSIPGFVLALLLQKYLGGKIGLPILGWPSSKSWLAGFKYTILPTLALCFGSIASYSRFMRSSVLDVVGQDYILTAKSKGVSKTAIIWKHIIRNAILPIITMVGPHIAGIITGSFVIESIFSIPGLGQFFVNSISSRDYNMIMATTIFYSFLYIASLLIVDVMYGLIDPRIRVTGQKR